ncbi:MAG TPA: RNA polymerase sigma factor [Candidatus Paceibacterota bacterium]|nr:RNA polymerase sigma factor [Candidatus Paceibacterota bacterium]
MDEFSFESLVNAHYEPLYRFALSLARSEADAGDLVQQTFCRWAAKGDQLRDPSKAKSWLFTTLHREFLGRRRHEDKFPKVEISAVNESELTANSPSSEKQIDGASVMSALHRLDEMYRAPLALFYLEEHSYRDIAEILEVPVGTVMSRISRGKELLRRIFLEKEPR